MRFGLGICVNRFLLEKSLQIAEGWAYLYSQPHVYFVRCCSCIVLIVCDLLYSYFIVCLNVNGIVFCS